MLASNIYMSQMPSLTHIPMDEVSDSPDSSMAGGYLSDLMTITSTDSIDSSDPENQERGNWKVKLEFILSCLGYIVGLGNIWRFPYLVYRNGGGIPSEYQTVWTQIRTNKTLHLIWVQPVCEGYQQLAGAFFIPYLVMLMFCGIPLVFMEMAFGQYASLGPLTIWKAVPIFKGIGYAMIFTQAVVAIYYNVVNAWAFHYLFSSMTSALPWAACGQTWNTKDCRLNPFWIADCSWINETFLQQVNVTTGFCLDFLKECMHPENTEVQFSSDNVTACVSWLENMYDEDIYLPNFRKMSELKEPSEEYFYKKVLKKSDNLEELGDIQWQLALYLLLAWSIVFLCLLKGIHSAGKVAYVVVLVPLIFLIILLIQTLTVDGNLDGVRFYVTPQWSKVLELQVWSDAASQVFFSLSACAGGLTALSSYNRFYNGIYRDAVIICLVDTLFSVLAGFTVFSTLGILAKELNTTVENVVESNTGLVFLAFPAAVSHFSTPAFWSVLFFTMIVLMGLSTMLTIVETIVTAILDEYMFLRTKKWWRVVILSVLCSVLYLLGLPLTTQAGLYLVELLDEFCGSIPFLIFGLFMCCALAWIYNVRTFCTDIKQMIGSQVNVWWRIMWVFITPAIIFFILVTHIINGNHLDSAYFPDWSHGLGTALTVISVISIPIYAIQKLIRAKGSPLKRLKRACTSEEDWGPAEVANQWRHVDYYPAVNTRSMSISVGSCPNSPTLPIKSVSDRIDMKSSKLKLPGLSHTSYFSFPRRLSTKKPQDIRQRAILNQAYCASNGSIDKLPPQATIIDTQQKPNVIFIARKIENAKTCDKTIQTDARSYVLALKQGILKSKVEKMTVEESPTVTDKSKKRHVITVDVEQF